MADNQQPDQDLLQELARCRDDRRRLEEELRQSGARFAQAAEDAQEALQQSEERFRNLAEHIPGISIQGYTTDGTVFCWNKASVDVYGYTPEEALGRNLADLIIPGELRPLFEECLEFGKKVQHSGQFMPPGELLLLHKDGHSVPVYSIHTAVCSKGREPVLFCIDLDLTDRKRVEEELRASESRLRSLIEGIEDALLVHDETGQILDCNESAAHQLGYSRDELLSMNTKQLAADEFAEGCEERLALQFSDGRHWCEGVHLTKAGARVPVDIVTSMIEYRGRKAALAVMRDITRRKQAEQERRQLEDQVQRTQKLESLGVMAGSIAHNFNNLLMGVLGNLDLSLDALDPDSPVRESLEHARNAARRASELSTLMLVFVGHGKGPVRAVDLSAMVRELVDLFRSGVPEKASITCNLPEDGRAIVRSDPGQMHQLVTHLLANAREAVGDQDGSIAVSVGVREYDRAFLQQTYLDEGQPAGRYVFLEITDTGCGIADEDKEKVFDPFYTTKFIGRGLGMAAVLGIVRGHKGAVKIDSAPGAGTTVTVLFSAIEEPAELMEIVVEPRTAWRGSGLILLVDDEEVVRRVAGRMLETMGFNVVTGTGGQEAIEIFRERADDIACVLLDYTMPDMDGYQTLTQLRAMKEDVLIIASSGHPEEEVRRGFGDAHLDGFIHKPYETAKLRAIMRGILGE